MKYMMLIHYPEERREDIQPRMWEEYAAFSKEMIESGHFVFGDALARSHTATTVRVRNGKTQLKDGPYAETKELVGGFYVMECRDLDEALSLAARIPDARNGAIEVRPLAEHPTA